MHANKSQIDHQEILKKLTLPLSTSEKPFKLEGIENDFCCDDWAWLFLRLNKEYQMAFREQQKNRSEIAFNNHSSPTASDSNSFMDEDGSCSSKFGLSAWLNPDLKFLPPLEEKNASWFFPLARLVYADPLRTEVTSNYDMSERPLLSNKETPHKILLADETPFGYRRRSNPRITEILDLLHDKHKNLISVAIDCGRPPEAQLRALSILGKITRTHLMNRGVSTVDRYRFRQVLKVQESKHFAQIKFKTSGDTREPTGKPEKQDMSEFWRVITLDALEPISMQMKKFSTLLKKEYKYFLDNGLLIDESPIPGHYKINLPTFPKKGILAHGGNYLKAVLAVHELNELTKSKNAPVDANLIMRLIKGNRSEMDPANAWIKHFQENIEDKYVPEGINLIQGGYRWLIACQKPKTAVFAKPQMSRRISPFKDGKGHRSQNEK